MPKKTRKNLKRSNRARSAGSLHGVLAALREYENNCNGAVTHFPHLKLFCDGSGSLERAGSEIFSFHDIDHALKKLKAANAKLLRGGD